jgi:pyridoxamine 5'-phosphate oxidase
VAYERTPDGSLDAGDLDPDPIAQFQRWFADAVAAEVPEPEAMFVATASRDGIPSARAVLLKSVDERGFVFFTNYESPKSRELAANPVTALVWWWYVLRRQVRVSGTASRVTSEESDAYFATRDRGSQLAAWASPQSQVLADRAELEDRLADAEARFAGLPVPRPPWWGGIRVALASMEIWQGRRHRLHDRFRYLPDGHGWRIERLAP